MVVEGAPLLLRLGDKAVPSLAAETLRVGLGASSYIGRYAGAQAAKSFGENTGLNAIKIGPLAVPTDAKGQVVVHYMQPRPRDADPRYISAGKIVAGDFDPARIADRIVLVGSSAAGLNDLKATPISPDMPGVEIHAQLIEQILQQDFLFRPDWGPGAEILFALLSGILLIIAVPRLGALLGAGIGAVGVAVALAVSWFAFKHGALTYVTVSDDAKTAVAGGKSMRARLIEMNEAWEKDGSRTLQVGNGINSGKCTVGNFGSNQKFNYSLLGGPVTLSSRLEGLTKVYGVDMILG